MLISKVKIQNSPSNRKETYKHYTTKIAAGKK